MNGSTVENQLSFFDRTEKDDYDEAYPAGKREGFSSGDTNSAGIYGCGGIFPFPGNGWSFFSGRSRKKNISAVSRTFCVRATTKGL